MFSYWYHLKTKAHLAQLNAPLLIGDRGYYHRFRGNCAAPVFLINVVFKRDICFYALLQHLLVSMGWNTTKHPNYCMLGMATYDHIPMTADKLLPLPKSRDYFAVSIHPTIPIIKICTKHATVDHHIHSHSHIVTDLIFTFLSSQTQVQVCLPTTESSHSIRAYWVSHLEKISNSV